MYAGHASQKQCRKCGSHKYETFTREIKMFFGGETDDSGGHPTESGIRCRCCGHELITKERHGGNNDTSWTSTETDNKF